MIHIDYKIKKCEICGFKLHGSRGLGTHLRVHNISSEDYYLKYVYKLNEPPQCPICGKQTKWARVDRGFACSRSCATKYVILKNPELSKQHVQQMQESMNKIDPLTGQTGREVVVEKTKKNLDTPIDKTGLTKRMLMEKKHSVTLRKVNPLTGLNRAQEFCLRSVKTKKETLDEQGNNLFQVANKKMAETMRKKVNPLTGLNRYQENYLKCKGNNEYKRKTLKIGDVVFTKLQGFEPQAIKFLVKTRNIDPNMIKESPKYIRYFDSERGLNRIYYPDFKIDDTIYEVKSPYTYKIGGQNLLDKIEATTSLFKMKILVMDSKENLVHEETYPKKTHL